MVQIDQRHASVSVACAYERIQMGNDLAGAEEHVRDDEKVDLRRKAKIKLLYRSNTGMPP